MGDFETEYRRKTSFSAGIAGLSQISVKFAQTPTHKKKGLKRRGIAEFPSEKWRSAQRERLT
jgi:hypothetical protein